MPHAGLTADQSLHEVLGINSGETVLVHAAAGGVGTFALQMARRDGVRVIGTSLPNNADYLRSLGAEPVRYDDGLAEQVRVLAPEGVDAVLDMVGGDEGALSAELLREGGRLASTVDFTVTERGGTLVTAHPDRDALGRIVDPVGLGDLRVEIADVCPLEKLAEAQQRVAERHVRGKVVIDPTA